MITINPLTMNKLYRIFLEKTGTFCTPCLRGIGLALNTAAKFRIPLTVTGTGWQVSYLAGLPEIYQEGQFDYFREVIKDETIWREFLPLAQNHRAWGMTRLRKILSRILRLPRISKSHFVRLYDFFEPDYDSIYAIIKKEMGWTEANEASAEHLDCELHAIAGYIHHLKFPDLSDRTIHRSGLVRMGKLGREEALKQDVEDLASLLPPKNLKPFLDELGLTEAEFLSCTRDWNKIAHYRVGKRHPLRTLYHKLTRQ